MLVLTISRLKEAINMKNFNQNVRHKVFNLIETLLDTNLVYLKTVNDTFIETYIHLTSGEKDPRNLMLSFSISSQILTEFDVRKYANELFDVTFCYFPITFEPPKNDPYGITSEDLRTALRNSISANGVFANDVFPGLLEKLTSSSSKIKSDTLITIAFCVKRYDPDIVASHWKELWDGLKFEIIHGSDEEETSELTLDVLRELASSLTKASDQSAFENYMDAIINETLVIIKEVHSKKSLPSIKLAAGIAAGSKSVFEKISSSVLKEIIEKADNSPNIAAQRIILDMIGLFVSSSTEFSGENLLIPYKDRILDFYSRSLMGSAKVEMTLRISAVKRLSQLTQVKNLLSSEEIGLVVQYYNDVLLDDNKKELKDETLNALIIIADLDVEHILTLTFPALLVKLPDNEEVNSDSDIENILYYLAKISVNRPTFEAMSVRLLNKLTYVLRNNCSFKYPLAIFATLLSSLIFLSTKENEDISIYLVRLVPEIFTKFVENYQNEQTSVLFNSQVIQAASSIVMLIVRSANDVKQLSFVDNLFKTFWMSEPSKLITSKFFKPASFTPFTASSQPTTLITLFTSALAPVSKSVELTVSPIKIIENVFQILSHTTDSVLRLGYLRLISLVINKWVPSKSAEVKKMAENLESEITNEDLKKALGSLEIYSWITKAYLLKTDSYGYEFVNVLIGLLSNDRIGLFVSKAFDIIGDDDPILSKDNKAVIRLLAKQRLFSFVLEPLVKGFKDNTANPEIQARYLVALSGILRHMPPHVISPDVSTFFPLLLQSLTIHDPKVREASISTITATLQESSEIVALHLSTLVPQLLGTTEEKSSSSAKVRIAAIQCLGQFPDFIGRSKIEPFRSDIINGLCAPLDDRKREVRRAAVNARQRYYEFTSAE